MQTMLEANELRVEYGPLVAVRDVSFALRSGDLLGLVGPNGAGKTTLLRALCGLQAITRGGVRVMERNLLEDRELFRAQIGFAPDCRPSMKSCPSQRFWNSLREAIGSRPRRAPSESTSGSKDCGSPRSAMRRSPRSPAACASG